jgi:phage terminase large subunit-like protein
MPSPYSHPEYQRNRKIILAGTQLTCAICGHGDIAGQKWTADHIIPLMAGGDHSLSNLQPAHSRCNSRRGSLDQARANHQKIAGRNQAVNTSRRADPAPERNELPIAAFFSTDPLTPAPINRLFFDGKQPELAGNTDEVNGDIETGRTLPRLETISLGGWSYGPLVAEWASKFMQTELMPWQLHCLTKQLETDDAGDFVHREALVSTARQNGKSLALSALIGWFLTHPWGRKVNVLSTANMLDRAEAIHATVAPILVEHFGAKQMQALGRKSVTMPDGSKWEVRAASTRLHGGSYDLVVADEIFDIAGEVMDQAIRPTMIAKSNPLLSMWSTAGDADSLFMQQIREQGLRDIDRGENNGLYFAEWSMPPEAKGEEFYRWANPALGTTITMKALRAASKKDYFQRAHLNQWVSSRGAWDIGDWSKCHTNLEMPAGGVLAVDSSISEARYVGVRAVQMDHKTIVHVEFVVDTEDEMWRQIDRVMQDKSTTLAITPTLEIHMPTQYSRRYSVVGYGELLRYTTLVQKMILEDKVAHTGSTALAEHLGRAVMVKTAQGAVLSSQKSPGPIELARVAVFAISLVSKPTNRQKPMLVVS